MTEPFATINNPIATQVRSITAASNGQEYRLFISLPASYEQSDKRYPMLYLLDGNGIFELVRQIVGVLQIVPHIPELIIVGIGYPKATYMETLGLRGRDMTMTELSAELKATTDYPFEETGGGAKFLDFIANELLPLVDAQYRTDPQDRGLAGWSLGATFTLVTLLKKPHLFNRLIANSTTLEANDVKRATDFVAAQEILPVKLFIGVESPADNPDIEPAAVEATSAFLDVFRQRNYAGFEATFRIFEGEDHFSMGPVGLTHGLRTVYGASGGDKS